MREIQTDLDGLTKHAAVLIAFMVVFVCPNIAFWTYWHLLGLEFQYSTIGIYTHFLAWVTSCLVISTALSRLVIFVLYVVYVEIATQRLSKRKRRFLFSPKCNTEYNHARYEQRIYAVIQGDNVSRSARGFFSPAVLATILFVVLFGEMTNFTWALLSLIIFVFSAVLNFRMSQTLFDTRERFMFLILEVGERNERYKDLPLITSQKLLRSLFKRIADYGFVGLSKAEPSGSVVFAILLSALFGGVLAGKKLNEAPVLIDDRCERILSLSNGRVIAQSITGDETFIFEGHTHEIVLSPDKCEL